MTRNIVIIDYGVGNILSIKNAISFNGFDAIVTSNPEKIRKATHIILPGVGAYPSAIKKLKKMNLIETIKEAKNNSYILGICLGMQLLFSSSEEFEFTEGLDLIKGKIIKLNNKNKNSNLKLPNIGWESIEIKKDPIFEGISNNSDFYFVHSFHLKLSDSKYCLAKYKMGDEKIVAMIKKNNIVATQFHPEKSQENGLKLLENFLTM